MGMDPVAIDESYEVTIMLEGPINAADFATFRTELKTFLDKFATINNTHPQHKPGKNKLQARESRSGVRKSVP
jgi:hypothetical protein